MLKPAALSLLLGAALSGAWACSSDSDPTASPSGPTGTGGSATWGTSACGSCERAACAPEEKACNEDPTCSAFATCLSACAPSSTGAPSADCEAGCKASGSLATTFTTCLASKAAGCTGCSGGAGSAGASGTGGGGQAGSGTNPIYTQMCKPSTETKVCPKCQFEKCCNSVDSVFGGKANDLGQCWLDCKDGMCESACFAKYPDQVLDFGGYIACLYGNCGAQCTTSKCQLCRGSKCKEELAACNTNTECFLATACLTGECATGDVACAMACKSKHPDGSKPYEDLAVCLTQQCLNDCGK